MIAKSIKFIIGLILIPVAIGASKGLFSNLSAMGSVSGSGAKLFFWGIVSYAFIHLFLFKPNYIYTLGHELMHAIAALLCGGRVTAFNVSEEGGSVQTTKTNIFITLSPYFVPTYTLLLTLIYVLMRWLFRLPNMSSYFFFLAGFTLMLHLVFTADVIKREQPDIVSTGYMFSLVIIYIINVVVVASILCPLFEGMRLEEFFHKSYLSSKAIYRQLFDQLFR